MVWRIFIMETILGKIKSWLPRRVYALAQRPYHFALAYAAALVFGFPSPSRKLVVIGVTGTKGKTTTVRLLHEVLSASGNAVASVSSLEFRIGERATVNNLKMTMPGRFFMQKFLRRAVRAGCRYAVMEVTSQGIAQYRHRGIRFAGAVMTNMAPEHLEAHGGFERYLRAKLDLFWRLPKEGIAVVNRDDAQSRRFAAATRAHRASYGRDAIVIGAQQWKISDVAIGRDGISFSLGGIPVHSPMVGSFNFYNILAAVTVGLSEGIALGRMIAAVERVTGVPGRMEFVARTPIAVVVDYAHTQDSLENVYTFLRENVKRKTKNVKQKTKKLICVLGCAGGGRDRWKRPEMGRIATEYCDAIILTNEDPYDENPAAILNEIEEGVPKTYNLKPEALRKILDRREAIRAALGIAQKGDTVIITGKGSEPWMMGPKGGKIAWDDRRIVREELEYLRGMDASGINTLL